MTEKLYTALICIKGHLCSSVSYDTCEANLEHIAIFRCVSILAWSELDGMKYRALNSADREEYLDNSQRRGGKAEYIQVGANGVNLQF